MAGSKKKKDGDNEDLMVHGIIRRAYVLSTVVFCVNTVQVARCLTLKFVLPCFSET